MTIDESFEGKVAIITGAGAGFGRSFAESLAARGASVVLLDVDDTGAKLAAQAMTARGQRALALKCDIADEAQVADAVAATVKAFGGVDILINNAGLHSVAYNKGFAELGMESIRRLFDVNVMGVAICAIACREAMRARGGGAILNISSCASYRSANAYGVSKLAVRGLTMSLAAEFAEDQIRVNAIAPGLIATDKIRAEFSEAFFRNYADNLQYVHRTGEVDDIVEAMLYLCSPRSSFITGETLRVSGGYQLAI